MSDTMQRAAIVELETRAGAPYEDRAAWLADRLAGITATQIRELYLQGIGYRTRLLQDKAQKIVEPLLANKYIDWGNTREPVIAAWVQQRYAIAPESRVFRAADNPRFLASPDGVGEDFDGNLVVSEIKTGKDDIAPGTEAYARKGYHIQKVWSMRVTGARRCLYVWEQHDSDWQDRGNTFPEPAPLHPEPLAQWIPYDEELAAELEAIAVSFLEDLDALVRDMADGIEPEIDDELDTLAVNLLRFREIESEGKKSKELVWKQMLERLEGCDEISQESGLARVTWTPGVETTTDAPDVEAAKAADPALFAEVAALSKRWNEHAKKFTKPVTTTGKATLTVTSVKPKKETKK